MANQRQPKQVQYTAPEARSSSFIEWEPNTIHRGLSALWDEFRTWEDNVYDMPKTGAYLLRDEFLEPPAHPFNPKCVFDISHHQDAFNMATAKSVGQLGVIIKATEGTSYKDKLYAKHYQAALAAGLLLGSYHFGSQADATTQANHYLSVHLGGIMALDFEEPPRDKQGNRVPEMTVDQAEAFIKRVFEATGRYPGVYADYDHLNKLSASDLIVRNCWVWLARYKATPVLPPAWLAKGENWTLWQYTDGTLGPLADTVYGQKIDHEQFNGTEEQLKEFWESNTIVR